MADGRRRQKTAHERGFDVLRRDLDGKIREAAKKVRALEAVCLPEQEEGRRRHFAALDKARGQVEFWQELRDEVPDPPRRRRSSARMPEVAIVESAPLAPEQLALQTALSDFEEGYLWGMGDGTMRYLPETA
jgi:hypothetical protein